MYEIRRDVTQDSSPENTALAQLWRDELQKVDLNYTEVWKGIKQNCRTQYPN